MTKEKTFECLKKYGYEVDRLKSVYDDMPKDEYHNFNMLICTTNEYLKQDKIMGKPIKDVIEYLKTMPQDAIFDTDGEGEAYMSTTGPETEASYAGRCYKMLDNEYRHQQYMKKRQKEIDTINKSINEYKKQLRNVKKKEFADETKKQQVIGTIESNIKQLKDALKWKV